MYYIGDMPRMLVKLHKWEILKISASDLQDGDLVFVKRKEGKRSISHIAMYIKSRLFHSCKSKQTAIFESPEMFFLVYEQNLNADMLIRYIDKRNFWLRAFFECLSRIVG